MFYTKYRPQKFSEISKPNDTAEALLNQLQAGKTAHAYLFVGSRGTGKTTTARILAKGLNCLTPDKNGDPCNGCENCNSISKGSYPDLIEIDAASNRGIDDIRELREKVKLAPVAGKSKVYIIDEVHMLTQEAFNALLKTLEEPPKRVCFILCTTESHKVPDTIKSRCQVFKFKRASISQIVAKLDKIAKTEKSKITSEQLQVIAKASLGGFRDAETLLQQVIEGNIKPESLEVLSSKETYINFLDALNSADTAEALRILNKSFDEGADTYVWVGEFISYLRTLLFVKSGVVEVLDDEAEEIAALAKRQSAEMSYTSIVSCTEKFIKAQTEIKTSQIPQLPVEIAIVSFSSGFEKEQVVTSSPAPKAPVATPSPTLEKPKPTTANLMMKKIQLKTASAPTAPAKSEVQEAPEVKKKINKIDLADVESKWEQIISYVDKANSTIATLLRNSKAVDTSDKGIELEVAFAFHKDRLESPKNKKLVESAIEAILGCPQYISCRLDTSKPRKSYSDKNERETGNLTDRNVVAPINAPVQFSGNILDVFDGGLPLAA